METRANYAMIGAFVIFAVIAALGFVLWLGQSQFNQDYDHYDIVFEGPVNLGEGASVRYIGIKVGEVDRIGIDKADASKVRARIRVDAETPVKTDSTASIEFEGITGVTFVQINAGSAGAGPLEREPGQNVPVIRSITSPFAELFSGGTEVMGRATVALERFDDLLSEDNVEAFSNILANVEAVTEMLAGNETMSQDIATVLATVNDAAASIDEASRVIAGLGRDADGEVMRIGAEVSALIGELEAMSAGARRSIEASEDAITAAAGVIEGPATDAISDFRLIAQDLRILIRRLDRVTRELEQNPQGLLRNDPVPYEGDR